MDDQQRALPHDSAIHVAAAELAELGRRHGQRLQNKTAWSLIGFLRTAGQVDAAEELLDGLERRDGTTAKAMEERARIAFARGDRAGALALLTDRYAERPSATAACAIARLHLEAGNVAEAGRIAADLMAGHGELQTVRQLATDVARASGDRERARADLLAALDLTPEHTGTLLALAELALEEGDAGSARAFFRRALASEEEGLTANQLLTAARIASGIGEAGQAEAFRSRAAEVQRARTAVTIATLRDELGRFGPVPAPAPAPAPGQTRSGNGSAPAAPRRRLAPSVLREHRGAIEAADAPPPEIPPEVLDALQRLFGHAALRPGQASVIRHVVRGTDTLAIMPTGAGKSLTFQLPAMLDERTTLVISPLIALMKDQVESLPAEVRERTTLINSTLSLDELRDRLDHLRAGRFKLVYVAPERLRSHAFLRALREAGVGRVVVDEAHCISMWGHDFRPDYLFIPRAIEELGHPAVLAITATATPAMVDQIAAGLGRELNVVRTSVYRSNLRYEVIEVEKKEQKLQKVAEICRAEQGAGIVYVSSRRDAESIAALLRDRGVQAIPYHAGLDPAVRARNQELFMSGRVRVVVATVAFGMGVDKADVRFIVHVMPPSSLEAYAQESGRAGRDGLRSRCVLLVAPHDRIQLNSMARRDEIELDDLRKTYARLRRHARGAWAILEPAALRPAPADGEQVDDADPKIALGVLEQAGLVHRHPDAPVSYDLRRVPVRLGEEAGETDADAEFWRAIEAALPESWSQRGACTVMTAALCDGLGITPIELDRALHDQPGVALREGARGTCLALPPVGPDAQATLQTLLDRARTEAQERIAQVMSYANARTCRHALLAAHLGERLEPCGSSCDVCTGSVAASEAGGRQPRLPLTAADVHAVLFALKALPFPLGRTGLVKLLTGSVESRIQADRSPAFGALRAFPKSKVDGLIDRLIEDGFIYRDEGHEYKLLSLTQRGMSASPADLVMYEDVRRAPVAIGGRGGGADADLSEPDRLLYERLTEWRRAKAVEEEVPPYVIAPNSALQNLVATRPATKAQLLAVPGFGETRVDRYGTELLSVIGEGAGAGARASR